jgi:hypothetical protein
MMLMAQLMKEKMRRIAKSRNIGINDEKNDERTRCRKGNGERERCCDN